MLTISNLRTRLVGPVSFTTERGECITIQGPSGSGKSLLLRAIVDLDPNEGDVLLEDRPRASMPAHEWRRHVAMVPAESGWWSDRVRDHFEHGDRMDGLLTAVGLPDALDWPVDRLSTGERQRLAIVRALCAQPAALLLDEPTAALDGAATEQMEAVLKAEQERGVAMILVTHDSAQAERLAARRYGMDRGLLRPWPELAT